MVFPSSPCKLFNVFGHSTVGEDGEDDEIAVANGRDGGATWLEGPGNESLTRLLPPCYNLRGTVELGLVPIPIDPVADVLIQEPVELMVTFFPASARAIAEAATKVERTSL